MTTFKIYVADLAEYNDGILKGEWFDMFDYSDSEELLDDIMDMLGDNEEWAIHDYDCNFDGLGEYESLEKLFDIKEKLEDDEEKTLAFIEYFGINEVENVSYWDDVRLIPDCDDEHDLGYYYIHEAGCLDIPSHLENYIDYEKYGRDIAIEKQGGFTNYGFIEWI